MNIFSTELFDLFWIKSFEGISSLTNSIIPPPELFLSIRNGRLKPSIGHWLKGKDGSTFVLETSKIMISRSVSWFF